MEELDGRVAIGMPPQERSDGSVRAAALEHEHSRRAALVAAPFEPVWKSNFGPTQYFSG